MLRHLTDEQVIEAAEGALSTAGARHLADCADCMSRVRTLQETLAQIGEVRVPEPPPAFWQHFTTNVNAAIREPAPERAPWRSRWTLGWATAAALVVILIVGLQLTRSSGDTSEPPSIAKQAEEEPLSGPVPDLNDVEADEAWAVVRSLAEDLHYDEAHDAGVIPRPESVEHAAIELSEDERAELIRIIEADLKRAGA